MTLQRCPWLDLDKPDYVAYHDREWGVPVHDDRKHFEFLTLESAQAGLSWYTVLRKRANYRQAFAEFDPAKVARFNAAKIEQMLQDPGLIRNRRKISAAVENARHFLAVQDEFGSFSAYIWRFVRWRAYRQRIPAPSPIYQPPVANPTPLSKDLKSRGFKFIGSTVIYAHMQATGMVNDHVLDCFRRSQILDAG